jgi:hypothetical protein
VIQHRGRRPKASAQESTNPTDSCYCKDAADAIEDIFHSAGWDLISKTGTPPGQSISAPQMRFAVDRTRYPRQFERAFGPDLQCDCWTSDA